MPGPFLAPRLGRRLAAVQRGTTLSGQMIRRKPRRAKPEGRLRAPAGLAAPEKTASAAVGDGDCWAARAVSTGDAWTCRPGGSEAGVDREPLAESRDPGFHAGFDRAVAVLASFGEPADDLDDLLGDRAELGFAETARRAGGGCRGGCRR